MKQLTDALVWNHTDVCVVSSISTSLQTFYSCFNRAFLRIRSRFPTESFGCVLVDALCARAQTVTNTYKKGTKVDEVQHGGCNPARVACTGHIVGGRNDRGCRLAGQIGFRFSGRTTARSVPDTTNTVAPISVFRAVAGLDVLIGVLNTLSMSVMML